MSIEQNYYDFNKEAQALIDENQFEEAICLLKKHIGEMPPGWKPFTESNDSINRFFWNQPEFLSFVEYYRAELGKSVFWRFPSYSKAFFLLSYILSDLGKYREALVEIERGLALEPDHPRLLCEKAYILGKLRDDEAGLSYLEQAVESRPWNTVEQKTHALNEQATTLMNLGKLNEAENSVRQALSLKPDDAKLKEKLEFIKQLQNEKKQPEKAPVSKRLLNEEQNLKDTYVVEGFLGEGAFAEVYRVKHRLFGRQALKIFKVPGSIDEISSSLEEAVLLSKLGHRGIVRVFDAGVYENGSGSHGYFTMEYIAGGSLYQHWRNYGNKLMPVEEAVDVVRQVAEGLALAHQDNPPIVHRDIKPHNILVGYDALGMRVCLSDFGLAKHVHPLQLAASVRGTLIYKAPETFSDPASDSCAGDVWALGVVLYQLLTNHFPYELGASEQLTANSFDTDLKRPQDFNILVDDNLEKIAGKALATEKAKRYQNAGQLLSDLRRWSSSQSDLTAEKFLTEESDLKDNPNLEAALIVKQAFEIAHDEGDLKKASSLLAEALKTAPELRERYKAQLKLWQSGKIM